MVWPVPTEQTERPLNRFQTHKDFGVGNKKCIQNKQKQTNKNSEKNTIFHSTDKNLRFCFRPAYDRTNKKLQTMK